MLLSRNNNYTHKSSITSCPSFAMQLKKQNKQKIKYKSYSDKDNTVQRVCLGNACIWSNVLFLVFNVDRHLRAGQQSHLLLLHTTSHAGWITRRVDRVSGGRQCEGLAMRVCVWVALCLLLCWKWGSGGFVSDIVLAEWAGLLEFQPGIHAVPVELVSAERGGDKNIVNQYFRLAMALSSCVQLHNHITWFSMHFLLFIH